MGGCRPGRRVEAWEAAGLEARRLQAGREGWEEAAGRGAWEAGRLGVGGTIVCVFKEFARAVCPFRPLHRPVEYGIMAL